MGNIEMPHSFSADVRKILETYEFLVEEVPTSDTYDRVKRPRYPWFNKELDREMQGLVHLGSVLRIGDYLTLDMTPEEFVIEMTAKGDGIVGYLHTPAEIKEEFGINDKEIETPEYVERNFNLAGAQVLYLAFVAGLSRRIDFYDGETPVPENIILTGYENALPIDTFPDMPELKLQNKDRDIPCFRETLNNCLRYLGESCAFSTISPVVISKGEITRMEQHDYIRPFLDGTYKPTGKKAKVKKGCGGVTNQRTILAKLLRTARIM